MRGSRIPVARRADGVAPEVVPESVRIEGDSNLRSAQYTNQLRSDPAVCARYSGAAGESTSRPNCFRHVEDSSRGEGLY